MARRRTTTNDSWYNPTTGVGGTRDKSAGFQFNATAHNTWNNSAILAALYEADSLAAVKVDALVDDAYALGWSVKGSLDADQNEAVTDWCDRLTVRENVQQGRKWSNLYGGGAVYMGCDGASQSLPLRKGEDIHFLQTYEKDELSPSRYYDDPLRPKFGEPSHYRLTPIGMRTGRSLGNMEVHESRFILFHGVKTTKRQRARNNSWGSSTLIRPMTELRQYNGAYALTLSLLADANQNVYKLHGLGDLLLSGREALVKKRIELIDEFRSSINALLVDAENEDFVRSQLALSGLSDLLTKYEQRVAAAFRMPMTRLMGISPAGLNSTGEGDQRNWNNQIASEQNDEQKPALERILRVAFNAPNGPTGGIEPDTWSVEFPPLWQPTPREQAEIDSINAQTYEKYVDMQVLKSKHIAKAEFSGADKTRPQLTAEEIQELETAQAPVQPGEQLGLNFGDPRLPGDGANDSDVATEDSEDEAVAAFAEQMTQHGIDRCQHDKTNRCRICGIERVRTVETDSAGARVWPVRWRPIGSKTSNVGQQRTAEKAPGQTPDASADA